MSYALYANDDNIVYGVKKFVVDKEEDIKELPISITPGSSALILSSSTFYVLGNMHQWIKIDKNTNQEIASFLEWGIF